MTGSRAHDDQQILPDTPFTAQDDSYHPPATDDPYLVETNWWSFNIPERRIGGWLHAAYSVNRGTVTWRAYVWDTFGVAPAQMAYYRKETDVPLDSDADLRDITFPGGGYRLRMIEPLMRYQISYADESAGLSIELDYQAVHAPRRFTPGVPPIMSSPHLDQLGHVTGELVLRGESIAIDCYSLRDRTWGPRGGHHSRSQKPAYLAGEYRVLHPGGPHWREVERQRGRGRIQYIFGHVDAETGFMGFVRPQDGTSDGWSPFSHGWLLKDGRFEHLDTSASRMRNFRDPVTGASAHMQVELADVEGRTAYSEGFSVSRMSETGAGGNALMRWDIDGRIGWGEDQDIWSPAHFAALVRSLRATS